MTPRQKEVLDLIRDWIEAKGISPSYGEIQTALELKSRGCVHALVTRLVEDGLLIRTPGKVRSLRLAKPNFDGVSTADLIAELESRGWKRAA